MDDKTYNGWKKYETWNVNLWLENEPGTYDYLHDLANNSRMTLDQKVDELKDFIENNNPLCNVSSMYSDLLSSALSEVDYHEIIETSKEEEEE